MSRLLAKDPARRCMQVSEWPALDRALREKALAAGDIIDGGEGFLAAYRGATVTFLDQGYGRWLQWLFERGELDPLEPPAGRITPERAVAFVKDLLRVNGTKTVIGRLAGIYYMARAQDPGHNLQFLRQHIARIRARHVPVRNKYAKIVDIAALYQLGLNLMRTAPGHADMRRTRVQFRDGLLISVLAACPLRTGNALMLTIGKSFVEECGRWWIRFPGSATKTGARFEMCLPEELSPYIAEYLTVYRPMLLKCRGKRYRPAQQELWITNWGTALVTMYPIVTTHTRKAFGRPVNPHLFRDCASTAIAIAIPERVRIVMPVLGHRSLKTSEHAYNHAQSFEAFGRWHERLADLRKGKLRSPRDAAL